MRKIKFFAPLFVLIIALVMPVGAFAKAKVHKEKNIEGHKVMQEEIEMSGLEYSNELSEDGKKIVKMPFYWFAGTAKSKAKDMAIEMAKRDAANTIAFSVATAVENVMKQCSIGVGTDVYKAIKGYWEQRSAALIRGCKPYGNAVVQYDKKNKLYEVTVKMAIRGDLYRQMLEPNVEDSEDESDSLTGDDLDSFVDANKKIFDAILAE